MTHLVFPLLIVLLLIAAVTGLIYLLVVGLMLQQARDRRLAMEAADTRFREVRLAALDSKFSFDGNTATVAAEHLEKLRYGFGDLHRICQNPQGEYFLYISGSPPYLCHLPPERALAAIPLMKQHLANSQRLPFPALLPASLKPPKENRKAQ